MTHPLTLHFRAAVWSLNASRAALAERARVEAEQIRAELAEGASDGLRSTVMGVRGGGGHGDPVAGVALSQAGREPRPNRFAHLYDSVTDTLRWLADTVHAPDGPDPLPRLMSADLMPATAGTVTKWLDENDRRIRNLLSLAPHLWALPGSPDCPHCRLNSLYVQTAAPSDRWTVICRSECVCSGEGCGCGMPVRVEGVAHIWDRDAPLVERALITPVVARYDGTRHDDIEDIALPEQVAS